MEEKKLTGYPSIDKPHYKYYRTTPVREINKNQTIYELAFDSNIDNMDDVALRTLMRYLLYDKEPLRAVRYGRDGVEILY